MSEDRARYEVSVYDGTNKALRDKILHGVAALMPKKCGICGSSRIYAAISETHVWGSCADCLAELKVGLRANRDEDGILWGVQIVIGDWRAE